MKRSLADDFFITKKEEWQDGFEGQYRRFLEELLQLLNKDLKSNDIEEYLNNGNLFVSEKFLRYILKTGVIESRFKSNAKRALSFITSRDITSRSYDERIEALGEEHAIKTYWEPDDESNKRRIEVISNAIALKRDEVMIDIGCGIGTFAYRMALQGGKAIGLDYSLASITVAKSLAERKFRGNAKILFIAGDATRLPFQYSSADVIVAADFIEHIDDKGKERFLDESARVLGKNGRMIIFTPNKLRESIGTILRWLKGGEDTRLHFGLTSRFSFERKLRKRGLKYKRSFVDVGRPFLATIPVVRELLALEILWVVKK
jgi:SAM-dependent methyltransferase